MMLHPGPTPLVFSVFLVTPAPKSPDLCLEFSTRRAATLGRLVGHDTTKRRKPIYIRHNIYIYIYIYREREILP